MNPEYHAGLTDRFLAVKQLPLEQRPTFLARLRAEDARMGAELESLLGHDAGPPSILCRGIVPRDELLSSADRVGPYRLAERIGEGGMGVVFRAEQTDPIEREVAIKLIRAGFETERVLARFETERRVLARMDHPNIARVLDAGTTAAGWPYVAMEYVRGSSITRFCDERQLDVVERLRLFLSICDAVHYAHQNAIIHRDLKPSNVLVALVDGRPVPKIIDFGIAKALRDDGSPDAPPTEAGQLVGTPAYMSPEQAATGESNPDIRSDVYSLGVLLYELLVGCTPLELSSPGERDPAEIRRVIRDQEPLRPSARVADLGDRATAIAARRNTDTDSLARSLRGDLDAIVMMALAKEPDRRYGSAFELAADVRRSLGHEPIHARPPAVLYRLGKLARRHRTATAVAAALVPVLVASAIGLALQARRVAHERDRAEEVSELLVRAYEVPFYVPRRNPHPEVRDVLRESLRRVEDELADHPVLQARMLASLGETLRGVGEPSAALPIVERAHDSLRRSLGAEDPRTLTARHVLGRVYADRSMTQAAEAELVAVVEARGRILGPEDPSTLRTMSDLALLYRETRRNADAIRLLERVVAAMPRALGPTHTETLVNASLLAAVHLDAGRVDDAEALLREYVPRMPAGLPERAKAVYNLGCIHALRGERRAAIDRLREAHAAGFGVGYYADPNLRSLHDDPELRRLHQERKRESAGARSELTFRARVLADRGRYAEAEKLYRDALAVTPPREHWSLEWDLATLLEEQGLYAEARPLIEKRIAWRRGESGSRAWLYPEQWHLTQAYLGEGDIAAALAALDAEIRELDDSRGLGARGWSLYARARRAGLTGDSASALRLLREASDAGLDGLTLLPRDLALQSLRDTPEFRAIVAAMKRRYELPT